ncbi:phosphoglycolate phosphatase [Arvimicrobium flavum]|uniref:phosphoglycolate phosphatase n=1 Tax=Arvimicrobium flavum TaxID=3393320 RepID=UPI00237A11E8|nr:phosphoglycolate phosphatase [Mesorhizobium shangrilense]
MSQPIVVFDLDGTLIDTAPDLLDSLNHSLAAGGIPPVSAEGFNAFVSLGGLVMIEKAFAAQNKALTEDVRREFFKTFIDHYSEGIPGKSVPYPGVLDALDRFASAGYLLAICTNKHFATASSLIAALGLSPRFAAITGQDTFAFRKPDPRHLLETIALAKGDPARALMIGDSRTDIDTAKAAGIPVVAVDFGYTDRHVREFEPSAIISHYDSLTLDMAAGLIAATNGRVRA